MLRDRWTISSRTNEKEVKNLEEERRDFLSQNCPAIIFILAVNMSLFILMSVIKNELTG
jgi:hypothetical protein